MERTGSMNRMMNVKYEKNPAGFSDMVVWSFENRSFSQSMARHSFPINSSRNGRA
jgi:hypothetical protein